MEPGTVDPFAGRIQDPASLHKYLYAHADPTHQVDPTGRFSVANTLTAGGIMNVISSATGILSTAFRSYRAAAIVRDVIDYSILLHRIIWALAAPRVPAVVGAFALIGGAVDRALGQPHPHRWPFPSVGEVVAVGIAAVSWLLTVLPARFWLDLSWEERAIQEQTVGREIGGCLVSIMGSP